MFRKGDEVNVPARIYYYAGDNAIVRIAAFSGEWVDVRVETDVLSILRFDDIKEGDEVLWKAFDATGLVLAIRQNKAWVDFGNEDTRLLPMEALIRV